MMKLTIIFLIVGCLQVSARAYSQKITLKENNVSLQRVFEEIQKQTDYHFFYADEMLATAKKVSVNIKKGSIEQVLDLCFQNQGLTYVIIENTVIIKRRLMIPAKRILSPEPPPIEVHGNVKDENGNPLANASVTIKGTNNGVTTNNNGEFTINVPNSQTILVVSYTGFETKEVVIGESRTIAVNLSRLDNSLNEVVVSALGVSKSSKSITYSTQTVSSEEITKVKDVSFANSLAGKVAGAVITKGNFGPGSSTKILLRGDKSFTGNSEPLYVIDGVPMFGGSDLLADINSEDIESIEILKGASASALYGSRAANGVILIVTKKGKIGVTRINVSSQFTVDQPVDLPKYQTNYGQTDPALNDSWGAKITNGSDKFIKEFFRNGPTWENNISVISGNDLAQLYFSYKNTKAKGILPENDLTRHNFTLRGTTQVFDKRLSLDGSVSYTNQKVYNENSTDNLNAHDAIIGLYSFPTGDDFSKYSGNNFEVWDPVRLMFVQNWPYIRNETFPNQNPYWVQKRNQTDFFRDHTITSVTAKFKFTNWLYVQGRGVYDMIGDHNEFRNYASTQATVAGPNGGYGVTNSQTKYFYSDVLLIGSKDINSNISLSATLGASNTSTKSSGISLSSTIQTSLLYPNYFSVFALNGLFNKSESLRKTLNRAVFGNMTLGLKERLFLDLTARQEWSSTLARSIFYPSVGVSYIAINNLKRSENGISYAKFRGSYAEVGNSLPFGIENWVPPYSLDNSGNIIGRNALPFFNGTDTINLKAERTKSFEFGADTRLLREKLSINLTYYIATTFDQVFQIQAPAGAGATNFWINGGTIRNKGIEGTVTYRASLGKVKWTPSINFSSNKNQILALSDLLKADYFVLGGSYRTVQLFLTRPKDGHYGSYGDMFGKAYEKGPGGKTVLNDEGLPKVSDNFDNYVGNANPKFLLGFNNKLSYKNVSASFMIDGRFGGKVFNRTEQWLDYKGLSKRTGEARDNGGVMVEGKLVDAKAFYINQTGGGAGGAISGNLYDVTNIRLRELALGYNFPRFSGIDINLSLIGRNLFFFYKKAPFDPEISVNTSQTSEGIASFSMPSVRSLGISFNATF